MNEPKRPIVIIQFSCDPFHGDDEAFDKEIESQRMKSHRVGRHNAIRVLKMAPKRKRITQTIKNIETEMAKNLAQEGLYEDELLSPGKKNTLRGMRLSQDMRTTKSTIDVKQFYRVMKNPNTKFYFLPIHGAHPKDFDNLTKDEYFITLPEKMYVITVTPMNARGLFFNNTLEDKLFFDYLTSLTGYSRIYHQRHKTLLARLIYNTLRIWGPGDTLLNREIQPDRDHQPMQRRSRKVIKRLPRAVYRNSMNSQMDKLYNDIAQQQGVRKTRRKNGGKRLSRKDKIAYWKKHTAKKYSHRKNKTGYRSDCSGFISYMWDIPLTDKGGLASLRTADWFKYSKPVSKEKLQSSDAILLPGKHVIMFDKWADKEHTFYWGYQMCNKKDCRGFTYMKLPFPYSKTRRPDATSYILLRRNSS